MKSRMRREAVSVRRLGAPLGAFQRALDGVGAQEEAGAGFGDNVSEEHSHARRVTPGR